MASIVGTGAAAGGKDSFFKTVSADLAAFAAAKNVRFPSLLGLIDVLLFPGTMAVILFRLSSLCYRARLRPISRLLYIWNLMLFGADLAPPMQAGPGLLIPHPVGVALGEGVRLGRRVSVMGGVQIGGGGYEDRNRDGWPTLGDDCWVFGGAKIYGPVTVGDRAIVGANSLVLDSVPAGAVVAGSPARVVRYRDGAQPAKDSGGTVAGEDPAPGRMNSATLDLLACPKCAGSLGYQDESRPALVCRACRELYEVREGVPVLLPDAARPLEATD